jgi:eukaryotic-like serine/threonine-protein kinase
MSADDTAANGVTRFGVFELDSRTGELRKQGVKVKLQGKPLQVLQALLERPGEVVSREALRARLWPSGVFVDFEAGLNTAANRLRIVLGDSADIPRYVETLPRVGYRFIGHVERAPTEDTTSSASLPPANTLPRTRHVSAVIAVALVVLAAVGTILWIGQQLGTAATFDFRQVTFRHGQVWAARFAPDGKSVLYTASWDNGPRRLFSTYPSSPESRALELRDYSLVAVSATGELALLAFDGTLPIAGGTLSRVPMNGGAPSPVTQNVMSADWAPDSDRLAIVHAVDGTYRLEFPIGTVLATTPGWFSAARVSPAADAIAVIEHPVRNDNRGSVKIVDLAGKVQTLSDEWTNVGGIAWHPDGDIWFTAAGDGASKSLWSVSRSGGLRPVTQVAGAMTLHDINPDGELLLSRDITQLELAALVGDDARNLTWLDWSRVADVSHDGSALLFDEQGVAAGAEYSIYIHRLDDGSTTRVGDGTAMALSPDGRTVLAGGTRDRGRLRLLNVEGGTSRELPSSGLEYQWVRFFPDGRRLLTLAGEPSKALRLYVLSAEGGPPTAITPPTVTRTAAVSSDGSRVALLTAAGQLMVYPSDGGGAGETIPVDGTVGPLLWPTDDTLYVQHFGAYTQIPTRISKLHLRDGRLEPWKELRPADTLGVNAITKVMLSTSLRTVAFNYRRALSELFVASPTRR